MDPLALHIVRRFALRSPDPATVTLLARRIREDTGVSRPVAAEMAIALASGVDVARQANQNGWPVDTGAIVGPNGAIDISSLRSLL